MSKASARLALPMRPRARRSHAERTAETRAKIIAGVVDSIAAIGFQRTTAQEITRRAGVTWGAVQHHFGGKHGLLVAVLEESFDRFAERLDDVSLDRADLAARAALFVDQGWAHFRSRHYRSTFEILLNHLGRATDAADADWRARMAHAWDGVWSRVFADSPLPRQQSLALQHFTVSALSGLASTSMLQGAHAPTPKRQLDLLKRTLARELRGAS